MPSIRSFIAVPIPDKIKQSVQDWIVPFITHDTSIKWVRPEGMHLTLKFLGNIEEERFEKEFFVDFPQLLSSFQPIKLTVGGAGEFPPKGIPRVLWLGIGGETEPLKKLAGEVDDFFCRFEFSKEKRSFSPHLTLARIRTKPSSGFLKVWREVESPSFGEFVADQLVFYRSELTKGGAVYSVIRRFPLGSE